MTRLLKAAAALLCALAIAASAQANPGFTLITGSHIYDLHGALLASGQIQFTPVSTTGAPIGFRVGGSAGGQGITTPYSFPVVSGVITADGTGLAPQLPDTSLTFPVNICYSVKIINTLTGKNILGPGYGCIQPSGSTWSFDAFNPNQPGGVTVQTGPAGPAGPAGTALNFNGTWVSGTTYSNTSSVSQTVYYSGSTYVSIQSPNIGHQPDTSPSWWTALVAGSTFNPHAPGAMGDATPGSTFAAIWGYPGNKNGQQFPMTLMCPKPGVNSGYGGNGNTTSQVNWSTCAMHPETYTSVQEGISEHDSISAQCARDGDCVGGKYDYINCYGGQVEGSGEGCYGDALAVNEDGYTSGVVTSYTAGAWGGVSSIIAGSLGCNGGLTGCQIGHNGNYFDPGAYLVKINATPITPSITGFSDAGSSPDGIPTLSYTTVGATLPVSTSWGAATSCTTPASWSSSTAYPQYAVVHNQTYLYVSLSNGNLNNQPPNDPDPDTAYWALYGAGQNLGNTTCTVTLGPGSGHFTTSSHVYLSGPWISEAVPTSVTAGSTTDTLTFLSRNAWDGATSAIMQGGIGGEVFVAADTLHYPLQSSDWPNAYMALGSPDGHRLYTGNCESGNCNVESSSVLIAAPNTNIADNTNATLKRTGGNLVTLDGLASNRQYLLRQMSIGKQIVVSGSPGGAFDGTFTVLTNTYNPTNASVTWNQSGSNTTASTFNIAQPNKQIAIYPGAKIVGVQTTTVSSQLTPVQGTALLDSNGLALTNGDTVIATPATEVAITGLHLGVGRHTVPYFGGVTTFEDIGPTPNPFIIWLHNPFGGTSTVGGNAIDIIGSFTNTIDIMYRPADGSDLVHVDGADPVSGVSNICYGFFHDTSYTHGGCGGGSGGSPGISVYPSANTIGIDGSLFATSFNLGNTPSVPLMSFGSGSSPEQISFNPAPSGGGSTASIGSYGYGEILVASTKFELTKTGNKRILIQDTFFGESITLLDFGVNGGALTFDGGGYGAYFTGGGVTMPNEVITTGAPTVSSGQLGIGSATATSATTGSNGALPLQAAGYLIFNEAGTPIKIPYFSN